MWAKRRYGAVWLLRALCVVPPGTEAAFLAPLPTRALWGGGPNQQSSWLRSASAPLGSSGPLPIRRPGSAFWQARCGAGQARQGVDERALQVTHVAKSLSKEHTFAQDVVDEAVLLQTLRHQAAEVASALQRKGLQGATVMLKLRWSDFTTLTRQTTLSIPTNQESVIAATALHLFAQTWHAALPVRLVGVGVSGFGSGAQASLWELLLPQEEHRPQVDALLLELRARFGERVIWRGREWKQAQEGRLRNGHSSDRLASADAGEAF